MKILHILRSEPGEMVRAFIDELSHGKETSVERLYAGQQDYGRLIREIFESDRVVCWW